MVKYSSIILCPIPMRQRLSFNLDLTSFHLDSQSWSDSGVPVPTMHNALKLQAENGVLPALHNTTTLRLQADSDLISTLHNTEITGRQ